jgi:hypothetical protein
VAPEEKKKEQAETPVQRPECDHPLVCPLDWEEPTTRTVITEYHKSGAPNLGRAKVEDDLDAFEEYWKKKGAINFATEYHKPGTPYMEVPSKWDGHRARLGETPPDTSVQEARIRQEREELAKLLGARPTVAPPPLPDDGERIALQRDINVHTIEVISYALLRGLIGAGVRIPLKRENLVDAEVTIKGKDVVFNTNQLYFNVPELVVWRIIYTHKGKPIIELGRGVKNGMKVHRWNSVMLGIEALRDSRRNRIEMARMRALHEKEQRIERGVQ